MTGTCTAHGYIYMSDLKNIYRISTKKTTDLAIWKRSAEMWSSLRVSVNVFVVRHQPHSLPSPCCCVRTIPVCRDRLLASPRTCPSPTRAPAAWWVCPVEIFHYRQLSSAWSTEIMFITAFFAYSLLVRMELVPLAASIAIGARDRLNNLAHGRRSSISDWPLVWWTPCRARDVSSASLNGSCRRGYMIQTMV